jgi:membrane protein YqaA with SNARE-associated domain
VDRRAKIETALGILRLAAGLTVLGVVVGIVGWTHRSELSAFSSWFIGHFGVGGMIVGSFLADGMHFPVPPQFYMLTGIASGRAHAVVFASVLIGSELGGAFAFAAARWLVARSALLRRWLHRPRELLGNLVLRSGYVGLLVATLLPISFSALCMASGALGLPYRAYAILGGMRVPRLVLSWVLIVAAWHGTR